MKLLRTLLTAASALCLSSCVVDWNIGRCIRESDEWYTGVCTCQADKIKYWEGTGDSGRMRYLQGREVRFRLNHALVTTTHLGRSPQARVCGVEESGKDCLVRVEERQGGEWKEGQVIDSLPADARRADASGAHTGLRLCAGPGSRYCKSGHYVVTSQSKPGTWRRMAAAPFDYLIDPILTVASSGLGTVALVPGLVLCPSRTIEWTMWDIK